jgi:transcriptional regulator with XRE-family HTH domain
MSKWLQQRIFAEKVKEYCQKNGLLTSRGAVRLDVVSDLFNLHEDTLRQFLQNTSRKRPHIDTLTHIAGVIGCSVTEFLDSPNNPPPGMPNEKWAALSEQERALASAMLTQIVSDNLSVIRLLS